MVDLSELDIVLNFRKRSHPRLLGETFINRNSFIVNIYLGSHLDYKEVVKTLKHELQHIEQVVTGRLKTNSNGELEFDGLMITKDYKPHEVGLE